MASPSSLTLSPAPAVGSADLSMDDLLGLLRGASAEQITEIRTLLARSGAASADTPLLTKPAKPRAPRAAKKEVPAVPLPEAESGDAPDADSYRIPEAEVESDKCVGRMLLERDSRWKPAVYRESQCGKAVKEGSDLCVTCLGREETYDEDTSICCKKGWNGRVTEAPPDFCHMLGTEWAKKCKWNGIPSDSASEASSVVPVAAGGGGAVAAATKKEAVAAKKEAEKAAKKAEKEAEKAAKKAEKEAEKAAKKAEKEAEKAEKEKAKKEAAKKEVAAKKSGGEAAPPAEPAKADTAAAAVNVAFSLLVINGENYAVRGVNVYSYSDMTDEPGSYVGRLRGTEVDPVLDTDTPEST